MKKRTLIGYLLIIAVFICIGAYVLWSVDKIDTLSAENLKYKNTKDCTVHERIIENLKTENKELSQKCGAVMATNEDIIEDAEYFLKQYYTRQNTSSADVIAKIEPLVSQEVMQSYKKSLGTAGGTNYEMGIEDIHSFCNKQDDTMAEVYCVFNYYLKIPDTNTKTQSTICFNANMKYDGETGKWIVNEVIRHQTVKYIQGF